MKNWIFSESKLFSKLINQILPSNILIVTSKTDIISSNLTDHRKTKIYDLIYLSKENLIINPNQFISLSIHGLFKNYKLIIFDLINTSGQFLCAYELFNHDKNQIYKKNRCINNETWIVAFIKNISENDKTMLNAHVQEAFTAEHMAYILLYANCDQRLTQKKTTHIIPPIKKWNVIYLKPEDDETIDEYLSLRDYYFKHANDNSKFEILKSLELINYDISFSWLKNHFKKEKIANENSENNQKEEIKCKNSGNDNKEEINPEKENIYFLDNIKIREMKINKKKFDKIISIIDSYSTIKIYIHGQSKIFTKLLINIIHLNKKMNEKFQIIDNLNNLFSIEIEENDESLIHEFDSSNINGFENILIFVDEPISTDLNPFFKVFTFYDIGNENNNLLLKQDIDSLSVSINNYPFNQNIKNNHNEFSDNNLSNTLNLNRNDRTNTEFKNSDKSKQNLNIPKMNQLLNIETRPFLSRLSKMINLYSKSIFVHVLDLIRIVFENNFLFFADFRPEIKFKKDEKNNFICTIRLPLICKHEIFRKDFKSNPQLSKKLAQNEACMIALNNMIGVVIDENLLPNEDILIHNNDIYYNYIYEVYQSQISFDNIFFNIPRNLNSGGVNDLMNEITKKGFSDKNSNCIFNLEDTNSLKKINFDILKSRLIDLHEKFKIENPNFQNTEQRKILKLNFIYSIKKKFMKLYRVKTINKIEEEKKHVENVHRIQPKCLSYFPDEYFIYTILDSDNENNDDFSIQSLGIAAGPSFTEKVSYQGVHFIFLMKQKFTDYQMSLIFFFQILFFGINYQKRSEKIDISYCYLALPIRDGEIDWNLLKYIFNHFIISNVHDSDEKLLNENLLFNPYSRIFYLYQGPNNLSLNDTFKLRDLSITTYKDYFEKKYSLKLKINDGDDPLFNGMPYNKKFLNISETRTINVLSSEILHVTSIKKNYFNHFIKFKKYLNFFDNLS
ncbi:hypothetical protein DMUE_4539, partial [Dictyocoela muelleri]